MMTYPTAKKRALQPGQIYDVQLLDCGQVIILFAYRFGASEPISCPLLLGFAPPARPKTLPNGENQVEEEGR